MRRTDLTSTLINMKLIIFLHRFRQHLASLSTTQFSRKNTGFFHLEWLPTGQTSLKMGKWFEAYITDFRGPKTHYIMIESVFFDVSRDMWTKLKKS